MCVSLVGLLCLWVQQPNNCRLGNKPGCGIFTSGWNDWVGQLSRGSALHSPPCPGTCEASCSQWCFLVLAQHACLHRGFVRLVTTCGTGMHCYVCVYCLLGLHFCWPPLALPARPAAQTEPGSIVQCTPRHNQCMHKGVQEGLVPYAAACCRGLLPEGSRSAVSGQLCSLCLCLLQHALSPSTIVFSFVTAITVSP